MKTLFSFILILLLLISCEKKSSVKSETTNKTDTILQKDGKVLSYAKFGKELIKMRRDQSIYSNAYETRIAKLVAYYLDKNNQSMVKFQIENPEAHLGYSVEETDWEGVKYTQIGLFNRPKNNITTFQWLFYNPKTQELFEFDVPKNKPILFPYQ